MKLLKRLLSAVKPEAQAPVFPNPGLVALAPRIQQLAEWKQGAEACNELHLAADVDVLPALAVANRAVLWAKSATDVKLFCDLRHDLMDRLWVMSPPTACVATDYMTAPPDIRYADLARAKLDLRRDNYLAGRMPDGSQALMLDGAALQAMTREAATLVDFGDDDTLAYKAQAMQWSATSLKLSPCNSRAGGITAEDHAMMTLLLCHLKPAYGMTYDLVQPVLSHLHLMDRGSAVSQSHRAEPAASCFNDALKEFQESYNSHRHNNRGDVALSMLKDRAKIRPICTLAMVDDWLCSTTNETTAGQLAKLKDSLVNRIWLDSPAALCVPIWHKYRRPFTGVAKTSMMDLVERVDDYVRETGGNNPAREGGPLEMLNRQVEGLLKAEGTPDYDKRLAQWDADRRRLPLTAACLGQMTAIDHAMATEVICVARQVFGKTFIIASDARQHLTGAPADSVAQTMRQMSEIFGNFRSTPSQSSTSGPR